MPKEKLQILRQILNDILDAKNYVPEWLISKLPAQSFLATCLRLTLLFDSFIASFEIQPYGREKNARLRTAITKNMEKNRHFLRHQAGTGWINTSSFLLPTTFKIEKIHVTSYDLLA